MRRRYLDESTQSIGANKNLERLRRRFEVSESIRGVSKADEEGGQEIYEITEIDVRGLPRVRPERLTQKGPFCRFMQETLFQKGSKFSNKQALKDLALGFFADPTHIASRHEPSTRNIRIAIINIDCNGMGDVVFGYKMYRIVQSWYPNSTVHVQTTNRNLYEQLGLLEMLGDEKTNIRQIATKPLYHKSKLARTPEENKEDECKFELGHLRLVGVEEYDLLLVAPIAHPGDATIGKVKKLVPYSTHFNTYFISEYNVPKYPRAVTGVDFMTGLGSDHFGLLFESEGMSRTLNPSLRASLDVPYGVAYMGVERPSELCCFEKFIVSFLRQYNSQDTVDVVISDDLSRAILQASTDEGYRAATIQLLRKVLELTNYNAITISVPYASGEASNVKKSSMFEQYDRHIRTREDAEFFEEVDVVEEESGKKVIQEETIAAWKRNDKGASKRSRDSRRLIQGGARNTGKNGDGNEEADPWTRQLLARAKTFAGSADVDTRILWYDQQSSEQNRPIRLLRLRGDVLPIKYSQQTALFANALTPVLVTGDQMVTDLLNCCVLDGGLFLYQVRPWKKAFARLLGDELDSDNILCSADRCSSARGSVAASAQVPGVRNVKIFHDSNDFHVKARPKMNAIVSMIAENKLDEDSIWNFYVALLNSRIVVKDARKVLRALCEQVES